MSFFELLGFFKLVDLIRPPEPTPPPPAPAAVPAPTQPTNGEGAVVGAIVAASCFL